MATNDTEISSSYVAAAKNGDIPSQNPSQDNNSSNYDTIEKTKIARLGVMANSAFFIGALCFLVTAVWEERRLDDSSPFYTAIYVLGFAAYLLNAGTEMWTDATHHRTEAHGRYVTSRQYNAIIGIFFGGAALVEACGMFLWDDDNQGPAYRAWGFSAWLWLISAAMTVWARPPSTTCLCNVTLWFHITEGLDDTANVMFLIGALIDVLISFMQEPNVKGPYEDLMLQADVVSAVAWFVDAIFYLLADYIRYQDLRGDVGGTGLSRKSASVELV